MARALSMHDQLAAGPVGVLTQRTFVEGHIARVEGSLNTLMDFDLPLDLLDRLERAVMRAHARNLDAISTAAEVEW